MASKVNLDIAEKLDITCRKGDTFSLQLTLKDSSGTALTLSTSAYEFLMQVKSSSRSRSKERDLIIGSASKGRVNPEGLNFSFTTDDSGNLTISASSDIMKKVSTGRYVYDLQQTVDTVSTTILEGRFTVKDDISKVDA